ncbi:MAG TPA: hypothetical protein PLC98_08865 [Anaerolineales bacterium]|nr:hypothetical protein [Anaerolineales bacterium]
MTIVYGEKAWFGAPCRLQMGVPARNQTQRIEYYLPVKARWQMAFARPHRFFLGLKHVDNDERNDVYDI